MPDIINSSFDPRLPFPLDVRQQVQDMNALYAIPNTSRWEGMLVYVRSSETLYILKGGIDNSFWLALQFNGGGGLLPNGIVIYGEAQQSGNDILLNDAWVWRIDQVDYQSSDDVISITPAAAGNLRVDIIVGDNLGNFVKVVGTEVASPGPAIEPNIPADTVPLLRVDVNDTGITAITEFVLSAFVRYDINDQGLTPTFRQNARTNIQAVSKDTDDTRTGLLTNEGNIILNGTIATAAGTANLVIESGRPNTDSNHRIIRIYNEDGLNQLLEMTNRGGINFNVTVGGDWKFFDRGSLVATINREGHIDVVVRSNSSTTLIRRDENYLTYPVSISGTGKLNDVALANGVGAIKFSSGVTEVSGIDPNGDTKELLIWSDNPLGITLPAEDVLSIAANRFHREVNVPYQTWVRVVYEASLSRWVNANTGELQETDARYFEVTDDVLTLKYILPDIAALQAFVRGPAVIAEVSDPLRGGKFNYVTEGDFVGSPDNGISFLAQDGGYWVRDFDGEINAAWYGLGTTDDTTALQASVDAVNSDRTWRLPKGIYITTGLSISGKTNSKFTFDGQIKAKDGSTYSNVVLILNCDGSVFEGLNIDGNRANVVDSGALGAQPCLLIGSSQSNLRFNNTKLSNSVYPGCVFNGGDENIIFDGVILENIGEHGFYISGGSNRNCVFLNVKATDIGQNAVMSDTHDVHLFKIRKTSLTQNYNLFFDNLLLEQDTVVPNVVCVFNVLCTDGLFVNRVVYESGSFMLLSPDDLGIENVYLKEITAQTLVYNVVGTGLCKNINIDDAIVLGGGQYSNHINIFDNLSRVVFNNSRMTFADQQTRKPYNHYVNFVNCKWVDVELIHRLFITYVYTDVVFDNCQITGISGAAVAGSIVEIGNSGSTAGKEVHFINGTKLICSNWSNSMAIRSATVVRLNNARVEKAVRTFGVVSPFISFIGCQILTGAANVIEDDTDFTEVQIVNCTDATGTSKDIPLFVESNGLGLSGTDGGVLIGDVSQGAIVDNSFVSSPANYPVGNGHVFTFNGFNKQSTWSLLKDLATQNLYKQTYDASGNGQGWLLFTTGLKVDSTGATHTNTDGTNITGTLVQGGITYLDVTTGSVGFPSAFGQCRTFNGSGYNRCFSIFTPRDVTGIWFQEYDGLGVGQGWKQIGYQAAASADTAAAVGVSYSQTEVQAILDELRDLKTKMRTAGLLAT